MYIQTQADGTITQVITVGVKPAENGYEIERASIPDEILQHIFQYKYINGEFIKNESVLESKIDQIRAMKIANMSSICNQIITYGIDLNNEHYSLTSDDQINLMKLESVATLSPETPIFYHPDGGLCRAYTTEEILQLANLATMWIVYHTTYFNFAKAQLSQETDVEKIIAFQYGDTLKDDFNIQIQQIAAGVDTSNLPAIYDDPTTYRSLCQTIDLEKLADEPIDLEAYVEDENPEDPTLPDTGDEEPGTEPTEPSQPDEPDDGEDPSTEPTDPSADPTNHTDPTEPTEPTDPEQPTDNPTTDDDEGSETPTDTGEDTDPSTDTSSSTTTETGDTSETTTDESPTETPESDTEETDPMAT